MDLEKLLILQLVCAGYLSGLIWVIQLVHYPTFRFVEEKNFKDFQDFHQRSITVAVAPVMILELAVAATLLAVSAHPFLWANLTSVLLIWAFTFLVSVPRHNLLASSRQAEVIESLIQTNWPRTILWTLRSLGLSWALFQLN